MKSYSRKQAGVIYRAIKEGKITMSQSSVSYMYDHAYYIEVYDTNALKRVESLVYGVLIAVDQIFEGDYESAQKTIDRVFAA